VTHTRAWRNFRRMQDGSAAIGSLIYAAAIVHAWRVLPGAAGLKFELTIVAPAAFLLLTWLVPLGVAPLRRQLRRYVWISFTAGFGQTAGSVISGLVVLAGAAGFIYWQVFKATHGGPYPAAIFSAYAAGIGVLYAQAILVHRLEREPQVRPMIEIEA
jgi:hypothetical protein